SSNQLKNYMASNLMMWEAIKLGKKLNCQLLDMWGAAPPDTDQADPWHGFTDFKLKYGGQRVEFLDSRDLIINRPIYHLFNLADKIRWTLLNLKRKL
ncbi:peptidoglycan bridge formation glycyltransferase FemA/FemB family protein, partial [Candidatus Parcubacteria bacterium]|nr:peptidoglycan bridge formation glycyltransferase FemA/FemB family protein [Candidatus Parcubacteria bacterium]